MRVLSRNEFNVDTAAIIHAPQTEGCTAWGGFCAYSFSDFGSTLDVSLDTLVIGATGSWSSNKYSSHICIYSRNATNVWVHHYTANSTKSVSASPRVAVSGNVVALTIVSTNENYNHYSPGYYQAGGRAGGVLLLTQMMSEWRSSDWVPFSSPSFVSLDSNVLAVGETSGAGKVATFELTT